MNDIRKRVKDWEEPAEQKRALEKENTLLLRRASIRPPLPQPPTEMNTGSLFMRGTTIANLDKDKPKP